MNTSELIDGVRAECGKLKNTIELENDDIIRVSTWVLNRIAETIKVKSLRYVTSVADQREYDVASTTLRVQRVYKFDQAIEDSFLNMLGTHRESTEITNSTSYYNFPSLWKIEMMRKARGLPRIKFEFDVINRKLIIDPSPQQSGDKYWYMSVEKSKWTLSVVPEDFEEIVVVGTTFRALEQIALSRSDGGGIIREGGKVDYPATELLEFVKDKRNEFYRLLKVKSLIYSR